VEGSHRADVHVSADPSAVSELASSPWAQRVLRARLTSASEEVS
jgi:hypothetical protein